MMFTNSQNAQNIRETVSQHLLELGANRSEVLELNESILHDGQREVAMRFRAGHMIALWNLPHASIHFYDTRGYRLRSVKAN